MSLLAKILSGFFHDAAVNKLASNKSFQALAVKVVDGTAEAQRKLEEAAAAVARDPEGAKREAAEHATSFWESLKAEVARDVEKILYKPAEVAPPTPTTRRNGGAGDSDRSGDLR
jgi:hypothetical protein